MPKDSFKKGKVVDGYLADFKGLGDVQAKFTSLQSDAESFFHCLDELRPQPLEFPAVAGDSQARMMKHSAEITTAAGLLSTGHQDTSQKLSTTAYNYGQAELANTQLIAANDKPLNERARPEAGTGTVWAGVGKLVGTAAISLSGLRRNIRLGRSTGLPIGGTLGSLLLDTAALVVIAENYRGAEGWTQRASVAARVNTSIAQHQNAVHDVVRASSDHIEGAAGDAFRAATTANIVSPYGDLANAVGEVSDYSSSAADAQQKFNAKIVFGGWFFQLAGITPAYLLPPAQVVVSLAWYMYVSACADDLKKGFAAAASHLTETEKIAEVNEKLRRDSGAPGIAMTST